MSLICLINRSTISSRIQRVASMFWFILAMIAAPAHSEEPVKIGLLSELSGGNAANGQSCRVGFELARKLSAPEDKLGTRTLNFIYGDHQGNAKTGVVEFKRMVDIEQVVAVLSIRSQVGMAINPLAKESGTPLIGIVGHDRFVSDNPFAIRAYPNTTVEARVLAAAAKNLGLSRIAMISLEDEWTESLGRNFTADIVGAGSEIVFSGTVLPEEQDFSSLINKVQRKSPDAIFINLGVAQSGVLIRKIREQGYKGQLLTNFWGAFPAVIESAGKENIAGTIYVSVNLKKPRFQDSLTRLFPEAMPSAATYCCYAALTSVLAALKDLSGHVDRGSLEEELTKLRRIPLADEQLEIVDREIQFDVTTEKL